MLAFLRSHVSVRLATIWLVVAIPLSVVLLVTYYQWYEAQVSIVEQERQGYAQAIATSFELFLAQMRLDMRASGGEVADMAVSSARTGRQLERLASVYPVTYAVFANSRGRVLASSQLGLVGESVALDNAFRTAMRAPDGGGLEPSEVASGAVVGFHVAQKIPARTGRPAGVMLMFVDVRKLHSFPIMVPAGGISIVDSAGQVVFQNEDIRFAETRAQWGNQFAFVRQALRGQVARTRDFRFPRGGTRIAVFVPVEPIGWSAGSSIEPGVALAPFYRSLAAGLPAVVAVGALALLVSIMTSRGIHRVLDELAGEARRIGSGQLEEPVRVRREDEIGEVAQALEVARIELLEARQRTGQELETTRSLLQAARTLAATIDVHKVLTRVAEIALRFTGLPRAFVNLIDLDEAVLIPVVATGGLAAPVGQVIPFDKLSRTSREAILAKKTAVLDYERPETPEYDRKIAQANNSRVVLFVPLLVGGEVVGHITLDEPRKRHEFSQREIELVEGVASQAAVVVRNARLFEAEARARLLAEKLDEINAVIHSSLEAVQTLQQALKLAGETLGASAGAIFLGEAGVSSARYQYGFPKDFTGTSYAAELFPFARLMEQTQEPVAIGESRLGELMNVEIAREFGVRSLLAIPLSIRGRLVGGIGLIFREPHEFTSIEIDFARKLGASMSLAIENARLHDASKRELARTTVLKEVAAAASELGVEEVAARTLETLERLLGATAGLVYRLDEKRRVLHMISLRGYTPDVVPLFEEVPLDERSVMGQTVLRDQLLTFSYDELPEATRRRAKGVGETGKGWVVIPARGHGRVVGSITLVFEAERHLDEEDLALLGGLGDQLGVALENASFFEAERERARFGRSMAEINANLASSLDIDETLPAVLEKARKELGGCGAAVSDRVEGGWRIRHLAGITAPGIEPGSTFRDEQAPTLMRVLHTRQPHIVAEVLTAPDVNREIAEHIGYRAFATYPLIVRRELIGAATVFFAEPRPLSDVELDYLRRAAFAVSLAEENSRLYKAEHQVAQTLQTALLALPERIPGVEFAHTYYSATEAARVGGDFYDLFELEHEKLGVTVGDISGHGVEAAVLTSLVKNAIRVQATQQDKKSNEVVKTASRLLYENSPTEIFATVFFGVLHLDDGLLEFCNAGHTTGACICSDGAVRKLASNSPLIGAFEAEEFELSTERVGVNDLLFLYTDGLTEARRDKKLFGEERLFELLAHERGDDPERTLRKVIDEVLAFSRGRLSDDLAVLALRRSSGD